MKKNKNSNNNNNKFKQYFDNDHYQNGLRVVIICALAVILAAGVNLLSGLLPTSVANIDLQLLHPEFLRMAEGEISPTEESLKSGMLHGGGESCRVYLPETADQEAYFHHVYDSWFSARVMGENGD